MALLLGACTKTAPKAPPPPAVEVATVGVRDVPRIEEWVGSLDGSVNAQIRAQVTGYLIKQDYKEGSLVKTGDPLFEIDSRPLEAALAQAKAQLAQADAQLGKATLDVERYNPLARDKAISQEELDNAVQTQAAVKASVEAARAAVDQATLNLAFTHIVSPIDGIAGLVMAQIGDLVGPNTGILTTVSTVNPIKAYFSISEQSYFAFQRRDPEAPGIPKNIDLQLILSDGSIYPQKGTFYAIDRQVESNTGALRVAALFPNPNEFLRPGQFCRVRAVVSVEKNATLVPTRALTELQGGYQIATVDTSNHVHILTVQTGEALGNETAVLSGLHPGDRVVAEGLQKVRDGIVVIPQPYQPAAPGK